MSERPFVFLKASSAVDLARIYRLRYRVYVEERGYEEAANHPGCVETDEFDRSSIHFLAQHGDDAVGTIRLVERSESGFPMEHHCRVDGADLAPLGRGIAEISRLAVLRPFRRSTDRREGPRGPAVVLGLFKMMYQESKRAGITHWCAAMERSLVLLLARTHIRFHQIGPEVAYHGKRAPYLVEIADMERVWFERCPEQFRDFIAGLPPPLLPVLPGEGV